MTPVRHRQSDPELVNILELIRTSFAYMDNLVDPPSLMHRLELDGVVNQCRQGEIWSIGKPPIACMLLNYKQDSVYLGKLAVAALYRRRGFAKKLIEGAEERARLRHLPFLELETRVELGDNHYTFTRLGFEKVGEGAQAGYDYSTFIVMKKPVPKTRTNTQPPKMTFLYD